MIHSPNILNSLLTPHKGEPDNRSFWILTRSVLRSHCQNVFAANYCQINKINRQKTLSKKKLVRVALSDLNYSVKILCFANQRTDFIACNHSAQTPIQRSQGITGRQWSEALHWIGSAVNRTSSHRLPKISKYREEHIEACTGTRLSEQKY